MSKASTETGFTHFLLTTVSSFPLSLTPSPLFTCVFCDFLIHFHFFFVLPFPSSLKQLLRKCSSCIALYFLMVSPSSLGRPPSVLQSFVSCEIPWTFLRHETLHFKHIQKPLILFSCHSSFFVLQVFQFFAFLAGTLPSSRI